MDELERRLGEVCGVEFTGCVDCVRRKDGFIAEAISGYFEPLCAGAEMGH